MRKYYIWKWLLFITLTSFHKTNADNVEGSTETNEIIPREAIKNLDFSVRQALLRAIDRLEKEQAEKDDLDEPTTNPSPLSTSTSTTTAHSSPITTKDEILLESVAPDDVAPTVRFFTATFDEKNSLEQSLSSFIDGSKVLNTTTKLVKEPSLGAPVVVSETEAFKPTSDVGSSLRTNEISRDQSDEIKFEIRSSKNVLTTTTTSTTIKPFTIKRKPKPTTTTTTTTTTPRPTHNEDGENIEVVDKEDIKIQEAPLVTAFTVDLDERGGTKTVVPIIHQQNPSIGHRTIEPTITKLSVLPAGQKRSSFLPAIPPTQSTKLTKTENNHFIARIPVTEQTTPTNSPKLNDFLLERQRQLEQQIYQLKVQAQQQQDLILRQLKILEQQSQIRNNSPNLIGSSAQQTFPHSTLQTQFQQTFDQPTLRNQQEFGFTVRPSIEFVPSTNIRTIQVLSPFSVEQQLPLNDSPNNKFISHHFNNNGNSNNNNVTPIQTQQLPLNSHVHQSFQYIQNSPVTPAPVQQAPTTVQIQQSNQLSFEPTFSPALQSPKTPIELSIFQPLPQHNYQQFQQNSPLVPSYVTNAVLQRQQQQQQSQQQPSAPQRFFRQETGTANFGFNQVEVQQSNSFNPTNFASPAFDQQTIDNQNFYRQHLDPQLSNQLQQNAQQYYAQQQQQHHKSNPAVNHGINTFGSHNLRLTGGGF